MDRKQEELSVLDVGEKNPNRQKPMQPGRG